MKTQQCVDPIKTRAKGQGQEIKTQIDTSKTRAKGQGQEIKTQIDTSKTNIYFKTNIYWMVLTLELDHNVLTP